MNARTPRTPRTRAALSYVSLMRDSPRAATWFDVADAFDAGQRQALRRPHESRRQLADVDARRSAELEALGPSQENAKK